MSVCAGLALHGISFRRSKYTYVCASAARLLAVSIADFELKNKNNNTGTAVSVDS